MNRWKVLISSLILCDSIFQVNEEKFQTLTVYELPLLLNDLVTQVSVLLKALHHKVLLPDDAVFDQSVGLHLCVLHLQLVDLAEEAEDFALLL